MVRGDIEFVEIITCVSMIMEGYVCLLGYSGHGMLVLVSSGCRQL